MKNSGKNILNTLSYIALIIVAFLLFARWLSPIISLGGAVTKVLETLQNILILIVIGISAFNFSNSSNRKWVKIVFWVAVAIFVVGTVLLWL